jgi:hypothetical protein
MTKAFLDLDESFLSEQADDAGACVRPPPRRPRMPTSYPGCTAVVAVLDRCERRLAVGNVGDARAVLSRGRKAVVLQDLDAYGSRV